MIDGTGTRAGAGGVIEGRVDSWIVATAIFRKSDITEAILQYWKRDKQLLNSKVILI